jgi:glucose-6-phosphate isomerase
VCSKTFTTQETQANAHAARAWIVDTLGAEAPGAHFVAVSTNAAAMDAFGLRPERRFPMWDWVGGRYSVWSAVGLVAELAIGSDRFGEFLRGASEIDAHFLNTPFEQNLPVLMGLIGVWNRTFLGLPTLAVLPYEQRLARLPAYLQQLEMESNGKSVTLAGARVDYATAPVVWGEPGSNAQHSSRCCTRAARPRRSTSSRRCAAPGAAPRRRISRCRTASRNCRRSRSA